MSGPPTGPPLGPARELFNRAIALLDRGRLAEGFALFEARLYHPGWVVWAVREALVARLDRLLRPGDPVEDRTILVITEQGLGDNLMFARFIPALVRRGARVIVVTEPALAPIMARIEGVTRVLSPPADRPDRKLNLAALAFDAFVPIMSLPHVFGVTATTIPAPIPYLTAASGRVEHWRAWLDRVGRPGLRRVGLVFHSNSNAPNAPNRSIPVAEAARLVSLTGVDLVNLQPGAAGRALVEAVPAIIDPPQGAGVDLAEYAAMLAAMDMVISADTMAAHLSGALGVPLLVALPSPCDWRWGQEPTRSNWYPGARLFRQPVVGDWTSVIGQIAEYLSDQSA